MGEKASLVRCTFPSRELVVERRFPSGFVFLWYRIT
jgi:hypothetical protein